MTLSNLRKLVSEYDLNKNNIIIVILMLSKQLVTVTFTYHIIYISL